MERAASDINREYYNKLSAGQEAYWRHMPAPKMRVAAILHLLEEINFSSLCDFGCGNGVLLEKIAENFSGSSLHGLDISSDQINENRRNHPEIQWHAEDLSTTSFAWPFSDKVDVGVSSEVIEHVDEPKQYLKNISSSLKEGGSLILTTQSGTIYQTEENRALSSTFSAHFHRRFPWLRFYGEATQRNPNGFSLIAKWLLSRLWTWKWEKVLSQPPPRTTFSNPLSGPVGLPGQTSGGYVV